MANYDVRIEDIVLKELQSLSKSFVARIFKKIESLSENPRPATCTKLTGFDNFYRIRSAIIG